MTKLPEIVLFHPLTFISISAFNMVNADTLDTVAVVLTEFNDDFEMELTDKYLPN